MGWSGGSAVAINIIRSIKDNVPDVKSRRRIYKELIFTFEDDADCDTLNECLGEDEVFDSVFKKFYPEE